MNGNSSRSLELIYFDYGGGHRNASEALEQVIKEQYPDWDVRRVNLFDAVLRPLDLLHKLTQSLPTPYRAEDVYNKLLQRDLTYGFGATLRLMQKALRLSSEPTEALLRQHWKDTQADLVVSLIPNFNTAMFRA